MPGRVVTIGAGHLAGNLTCLSCGSMLKRGDQAYRTKAAGGRSRYRCLPCARKLGLVTSAKWNATFCYRDRPLKHLEVQAADADEALLKARAQLVQDLRDYRSVTEFLETADEQTNLIGYWVQRFEP
jgi:hypothetical protein